LTNEIKIKIERSFKYKEAAQKLERISFILGGFILLVGAYEKLPNIFSGIAIASNILTAVSFAAGAADIFYAILIRRFRDSIYYDFFTRFLFALTGLLLLIETFLRFSAGENIFILLFFASLFFIALAIYHSYRQSLKLLSANEKGLSWRPVPFIKRHYTWDEMSSVFVEGQKIKISLNDHNSFTLIFAEDFSVEDYERLIQTIQKYSGLEGNDILSGQIFEN
jgi:hypothetical protein